MNSRRTGTLLSLWFALFALAGCGGGSGSSSAASPELTILAAASLTDAFSDLATAFEAQNDGVTVVLNFAGSAQLAAQLREGAAADLFASANPAQVQAVVDAGRVTAGAAELFASNRLTIIVPAGNPAAIATLDDLARPGVQLLVAAPGVPVRQYTDEVLARLPLSRKTAITTNIVSEESNVRQVAAKIALGEADAGIVYTTDLTPDIAGQVQQVAIPAALNVVATYPIAPLSDAPHPAWAQRFIEFTLSPEGQAILAGWGFVGPPEVAP